MGQEKKSARDRLLGRKRPSLSVPLAVEDVTGPSREVALTEDAWRTAQLGVAQDTPARVKAAKADLDAAIRALDACYEHVTVTALPPVEFEALVAKHPGRDGEDEAYNIETFPRALFIACAGDELSADEWNDFLDTRCSQAERDALLFAATNVNSRTPNIAVPKG